MEESVEKSVDNVTQVPNVPIQQTIQTISTVCDASKSLSDGVPQIIGSSAITRDCETLPNSSPPVEYAIPKRRASLPAVSTDSLVDDNNDDPPNVPPPMRKTSSPQKRPRSASTSTQVDPNHFGEGLEDFSSNVFQYT